MSQGWPEGADGSGLSPREREVLRLLAAGKGNREIADALVISLNTVLRHVNHIFTKLGVSNRIEAALSAQRQGLVGPSPDRSRAPTPAGPPSGPVGARSLLPAPLAVEERTPFVGRDAELAQLAAAFARARAGQPQVVLLAGEPGIGKTRLAAEFARATHVEGATVLLGRCDEEVTIPYQPFIEALRRYLRSAPPDVLDRNARGGELARLIPELAGRDVEAAAGHESPEMRRHHLFESVGALLAGAATSAPIVVLLEDLHWAERPTLLMLRHLARTPPAAPLLVVGTYRETELSRAHPLGEMLADLRRERHVARLALRGLDQPAVAALMDAWTGVRAPAPMVRAVHAQTEGVPFFVEEVLQHLEDSGAIEAGGRWRAGLSTAEIALPEGVREVLGRRFSRLSEACRRALSVASVIGREFAAGLLARVVDLSEDDLIGALEEALAARLIADIPQAAGRYGFAHAFIRQTLYEEISAIRRVYLHRRVGEALEAMHRADDPSALEALAHHFVEAAAAGDAAKAVDYATRAGDHAAAALAYEEAARHYGRALRLLDDLGPDDPRRAAVAALRAKRGAAFIAVGLWTEAKPELEAALADLPAEQTERRAEILAQLAGANYWLLDGAGAIRAAEEALPLARQLDRPDLVADALIWRASGQGALAPDIAAAARALEEAVEEIGPRDNLALRILPTFLYLVGRTEDAVRVSLVGAEAVTERPDVTLTMFRLSSRGLALTGAGRYREAAAAFAEMRAFGSRYGATTMLARGIACSGAIYGALHNHARAEAAAREARELAHGFGFVPTIVQAGIDLVFILARTGRLAEAERALAETGETLEGMKGWHAGVMRSRFLAAAAEVAVARAGGDRALETASAAIAEARSAARPKYEALSLGIRAAALAQQGREAAATADLRAALAVARPIGDPALTLHTAAALLALAPTDDLIRESRAALDRIVAELPDEELGDRFAATEPVRLVLRLAGQGSRLPQRRRGPHPPPPPDC